ncbi:carboxypeptidase-like regulatory domain-containing protein, partial [Natrialba sp. SSL1]|uniref:carboxypeptidase-like regulatory domain-containing protein n=1 Tax=Natrialba sp. SSL1 TaxID=1869245 RepID=UPI000AFCFF14
DAFTVLASNFEVSNLDAPDEADRGDEITVSANVTNTGNVDDTQSVEYRFDDLGDALDAQNVTLEPDENTTVSFDVDTENVTEGTYDHGVFTEDDEATTAIDILEPFFSVDITDAPEELAPGDSYSVNATVENTGDAPDEQTVAYELGDGGGDVAVVDVAADTSQGDAVASVLDERLNDDTYDVDVVVADDLLDEMDDYDTFVVQRLGSDTLAEDFLDELESAQNAVYLDSHQGGSAETYADGIYRLNNVREDPAERDSEGIGTSDEPVTIDIEQSHPIFTGVGDAGDEVEMFTGTTTWGSWFDDYSGTALADADFGDGYAGPSVAVSDDGSELLLTATARDFFTDEEDFTEEANLLLANSVEFATTGSVTADAATADSSSVVHLEPGESEDLTFSDVVPEDAEAGDASHTVASEDEQDFAPVTITGDETNWNVKGTVSDDATGEPIANASVELEADNDTFTNVTESDGKYGLADVPAGEHDLTVDAEGYASHTDAVHVLENDTVTVNVSLQQAAGAISGEVTASDDDAPVENATVVAENDDGDVHEATTDENGSYELDGVSAGTYVVNVVDTPPGYELDEIVTVEPGEHVENVDFVVDRTAGSIEGTVTNAAGVPIADANVVDADDGAFNVTTAEDGSYEIEDVTPGTNALRAVADGYDDSNVEFVEVETGETTTANLTLGTYFEVDDLAAPDSAEQGEEITVNATVTNTGEQEDTRTAFYFPPGTDFGPDVIDSQPELAETVTLEGGESTTVEFTYEIGADDEPGEYEHGISADEVESTTITIEAADDGDASIAHDVTDVTGPNADQLGAAPA